DMPRTIARRSPNFVSCGRCSPILRPAALVAISLNGPPLAWPGLRSHRSMVDGPPFIHRRMHDRFRAGSLAAAVARGAIHPETEAAALAAPSRRKPRRLKSRERMGSTPLRGVL